MSHHNQDLKITETAELLIRSRRSKRDFFPEKIPQKTLTKIFELANQAPSSTNVQARKIEVVSGPLLIKLSVALKSAFERNHTNLDFKYTSAAYDGVYTKRMQDFGAKMYGLLKVTFDDQEGKKRNYIKNLEFFGAPHAAFLFVPNFDVERNLNDIGMYGQTLLLAMKAYGVDSCPQAVLGMYCDVIRETLGVSSDFKLLWGVSFGYANPGAQVNQLVTSRAPLEETVTFRE